MHLLTTFDFRETDLKIDYVRRHIAWRLRFRFFLVFTREVQVKISHPFQNDSLLCLDTITALGLQYVLVRKAGRFIGELASVVINFRERNRRLSHGQLSWSFVDELGFELASRHLWLLTFLKSPKCIFSDGSTYNSWNAAAGVTVAGCHELPTIPPSDMSLNHIDSESIDLISFDGEIPASTPIAVGGVSDVFVNNSSLNPCDDLLDDPSVSRMEGLLCEIYKNMGRIDKLTNEAVDHMKLMNSNLQHIHHQMTGIGDHHLNEILIDWILPIFNVERFPEVIPNEILKIMSVQSTYVAVMPAGTTIILLKDCSHNKPRSPS